MVVTDCIVLWCGVIEAPQWNCERTIHNPVLCQYNISLVNKFKMLYTYITLSFTHTSTKDNGSSSNLLLYPLKKPLDYIVDAAVIISL